MTIALLVIALAGSAAAAPDLVLLRAGADLRRTVDDELGRPLARTVTAEVLERRGDLLLVATPTTETCAAGLPDPVGYALRWWVREGDLAPALVAPLDRTWPDGSAVHVQPGTPVEVHDDGTATLRGRLLDLRRPVADLRIGTHFAPPSLTPTDQRTAWPLPWASLRLGDGTRLGPDTGTPAADVGTEAYREACLVVVGAASPWPPRPDLGGMHGVAGGVLGQRGGDTGPRPPPLDVPAGTEVRWSDGPPAGRTRAPVRWSDWTARGDEVCAPVAMPDELGGGPELLCLRAVDVGLPVRPASVRP
jgi:hypothetical protein